MPPSPASCPPLGLGIASLGASYSSPPTHSASLLNGDGEVSRDEFRKAIPAIGLNVPQMEVDALFNEWDKGGDGAIGLREMMKILKAPKSAPQKKIEAAGGAALAAVKVGKLAGAFKLKPAAE